MTKGSLSMVHACVLVKVSRRNFITRVLEEVASMPEVGLAVAITGDYDILLMIQATDTLKLGEFIIDSVENLTGVLTAVTMVAVTEMSVKSWLAEI